MVILSRGDGEGQMCTLLGESRAALLECETVFVRSLSPFGMTCVFVSLAKFATRRKEPRDGSAEEISFPWDLRHGHGVGSGSAEGARIRGHWVGRKCVSADVDFSSEKGHLVKRGVSRGKYPGGCGRGGDRQRNEAWQSGSRSRAEQKAPLPFVAGSAEKLFLARPP